MHIPVLNQEISRDVFGTDTVLNPKVLQCLKLDLETLSIGFAGLNHFVLQNFASPHFASPHFATPHFAPQNFAISIHTAIKLLRIITLIYRPLLFFAFGYALF